MKALLRTADGLECLVEVPKFSMQVRRPVVKHYRQYEQESYTVTHVRIYYYLATRVADDMPIYEEVIE